MYSHTIEDNIIFVKLAGKMRIGDSAQIKEFILRVMEENASIGLAIDMADVDFIDSASLGVLVLIYYKLNEHKRGFVLYNLKEICKKMITNIAKMDKFLKIADDKTEAITVITNFAKK